MARSEAARHGLPSYLVAGACTAFSFLKSSRDSTSTLALFPPDARLHGSSGIHHEQRQQAWASHRKILDNGISPRGDVPEVGARVIRGAVQGQAQFQGMLCMGARACHTMVVAAYIGGPVTSVKRSLGMAPN